MLTEQHRMAPPIRSLVSALFYAGALTDGACPSAGRVLVLDTSATEARAATHWIRMRSSRENTIHRHIMSQVLSAIRRDKNVKEILVLTPFLAQKRLYEREAITGRVPGVRFATVHSSQGTESDVVILDLVVAPGRGKSRFLDERRNAELRNLLNVALSRAKRELIIVAHAEHIREEYLGQVLCQLLDLAEEHGVRWEVPSDSNVRSLFRRDAA
jgi:superfamily I DNA and/or RNA helicase